MKRFLKILPSIAQMSLHKVAVPEIPKLTIEPIVTIKETPVVNKILPVEIVPKSPILELANMLAFNFPSKWGAIKKNPYYIDAKAYVESNTNLTKKENIALRAINEQIMENTGRLNVFINVSYIYYLHLQLEKQYPKYALFQCYLGYKAKIIDEFDSLFFAHIEKTSLFEKIMLMEYMPDAVSIVKYLTEVLLNYKDVEAVEFNNAFYICKIRNSYSKIFNLIPKNTIYNYLDHTMNRVVTNQLILSKTEKVKLAINMLNHHSLYNNDRATLLLECIQYPFKDVDSLCVKELWSSIKSLYNNIFNNKKALIDFNDFCMKCLSGKTDATLYANIRIIYLLLCVNHQLLRNPQTFQYIKNILATTSPSDLSLFRRILIFCYHYNKMLFEGPITPLINALIQKQTLTERDIIDALIYCWLNPYDPLSYLLLTKCYPDFHQTDFKLMRILKDHYHHSITRIHLIIIEKLGIIGYNHVLQQFASRFSLAYYSVEGDIYKLAPILYIMDNPQLILKIINSNINYNFFHRVVLSVPNLKTIHSYKDKFLFSLSNLGSLYEISHLFYAIKLCEEGTITYSDATTILNYFDEYYHSSLVPMLIYFACHFNVTQFIPTFKEIKNKQPRKCLSDIVSGYCAIKPYLKASIVLEFDKGIKEIIYTMSLAGLQNMITDMSYSYGYSVYNKPLVRYIIEKLNENGYASLTYSTIFKCNTNILKDIVYNSDLLFHNLIYALKAVSYWGNSSDIAKLYSVVSANPVIDMLGDKLFESFSKGKNSDYLFYLLTIPIVNEYLITTHQDPILKCLELSENWNLYFILRYVFNFPLILPELHDKIQKSLNKAWYMYQCFENKKLNEDINSFNLSAQIISISSPNDPTYPYYCPQK